MATWCYAHCHCKDWRHCLYSASEITYIVSGGGVKLYSLIHLHV